MAVLAAQTCKPCHGEEAKLASDEANTLLAELDGWKITPDATAIHALFRFKNFVQALEATNRIGVIAEECGHHPDITLGWGYVGITLTTHDCGGLSRNDFIVAAKIDALGLAA
jgi:4a-hydroxytetrahydrobiopterin dehydratase